MSENPYPPISSGEPDCEALQSLLPAYSIGATDAEETRLVETLLPFCPEVASELHEYAALAEAMLQTATPVMPPVNLHDKLMAATASTAAPGTLVINQPKITPAPVVRVNRFWMAASAAMLVLLVASNVYWERVVSDVRKAQETLIAQVQQQDAVVNSLTSGNIVQVALASSQGNARVFWNTQQHVAVLSTEGLPELSQAETYQLWLIGGDGPVSAGTFQVDDTGRGILFFVPPRGISEYDAVGISTEPAGGSDAPTTTPIAVGEI